MELLNEFLGDLLALDRQDFARVMRAIRNAVDATRRALDDPTGAYTVGALESLGDQQLVTPTTWERYDPAKRTSSTRPSRERVKLIERVHAAVLVAVRRSEAPVRVLHQGPDLSGLLSR